MAYLDRRFYDFFILRNCLLVQAPPESRSQIYHIYKHPTTPTCCHLNNLRHFVICKFLIHQAPSSLLLITSVQVFVKWETAQQQN